MQRLREISERSHIRSRFDPDGASPVELSPAQRASLLVILDDWPETMPQELLELRNALITDVRCRKSTAPAASSRQTSRPRARSARRLNSE